MKVNINGIDIELYTGETMSYTDVRINDLLRILDGLTFTKKEEDKQWSPKDLKNGDFYWYLDSSGKARAVRFQQGDEITEFDIKSGNCYETKEKAELAYEEIMKREIK